VPVAEELGEGAVRDAELGDEAHGVDGVATATGALPRPGRALARRRRGRRRVATEWVTMPASGMRATAWWEMCAARGDWAAVGADKGRRGPRDKEE
jgi:hypothetical protein